MPYITCKDGKTYSRYDASEYAQNCIALEKKETTIQTTACNRSQECIGAQASEFVFIGFVGIILILITIMAYKFFKTSKDIDTTYRQQ